MSANLIIRSAVPAGIALLLASCGGDEARVKDVVQKCVETKYRRQASKIEGYKYEVTPSAVSEAGKRSGVTWVGNVVVTFAFIPNGSTQWANGQEILEPYVRDGKAGLNPLFTGGDPCASRY
jgi:hypothetical protein